MNKQAFLTQLRKGLSGLPREDMEERLTFYREMIEDRMEEGLPEAEAVKAVGEVDGIIAQIIAEKPAVSIPKEQNKPVRRWRAWEIVLLALGSPVWVSLLISAIAVLLSLYAALWAVVISLWAAFGALAGSALGGIISGVACICADNALPGAAVIAMALVCAGLAIFAFYGCKAATRGTVALTKRIPRWVKGCFGKKEAAQ